MVEYQIAHARPASPQQTDVYMPQDLVTGQDAKDVAAYVASVAGVPGHQAAGLRAAAVLRHQLRWLSHPGAGGHDRNHRARTSTTALKGMSATEISQSISDPNAKITPGYPPNVMPQNFGQTLTPDQLSALVAYLQQATGGGGGGGGKK